MLTDPLERHSDVQIGIWGNEDGQVDDDLLCGDGDLDLRSGEVSFLLDKSEINALNSESKHQEQSPTTD